MNFTEFINSTTDPLYILEGNDPTCPAGFTWNKKLNTCVADGKRKYKKPKQDKNTQNKDSIPANDEAFMVFGSNGMDGGYAIEEPPTTKKE